MTYDFSAIRQYVGTAYDGYSTKLIKATDGYYQVTYGNCPSSTGFNVIPLEVPAAGSVVTVDLKGLTAGSKLANGDIKLLAQAFVMDASKLSSYTIKPVLVYTKGGKQYKATITLNMKY